MLNKSTEDVLCMRSEGDWKALSQQFPKRLLEVIELAHGAVEDFSPAQLIDQLDVFSHLSTSTKRDFRHALHSAYLRYVQIEPIVLRIAAAATRLKIVLGMVTALWRDGTEPELRRAWAEALAAAAILRDELEALPKGIVLP